MPPRPLLLVTALAVCLLLRGILVFLFAKHDKADPFFGLSADRDHTSKIQTAHA